MGRQKKKTLQGMQCKLTFVCLVMVVCRCVISFAKNGTAVQEKDKTKAIRKM